MGSIKFSVWNEQPIVSALFVMYSISSLLLYDGTSDISHFHWSVQLLNSSL